MSLIRQAFADWRECREAYEETFYAQYMRAEHETHGVLLNERGKRADIDPMSLFMGPWRRAVAYASPELIEHWAKHPRVTFADFEKRWAREREEALAGAA